MAYTVDESNGDLVIGGFQQGIGPSPYQGLTDARNVNLTSVPGEASVGFATQAVAAAPTNYTGLSVTVPSVGVLQVTGLNINSLLEQWQAVTFTASSISGVDTGVTYWIYALSKQSTTSENFSIVAFYGDTHEINTGSSGTATMNVVPLVLGPRGFLNKNFMVTSGGSQWLLDSNGQLWSNILTTAGGTGITATNSWTYVGNIVSGSGCNGNGLATMTTVGTNSAQDQWIFIFEDGQIDYIKTVAGNDPVVVGRQTLAVTGVINSGATSATLSSDWAYATGSQQVMFNNTNEDVRIVSFTQGSTSITWTGGLTGNTTGGSVYIANLLCIYGWGAYSTTTSAMFGSTTAYSHEAITTPFNQIVFCDGFTMGTFYQLDIGTPFDPTNDATYDIFIGLSTESDATGPGYTVLPASDIAQCCDYMGSYVYIGAQSNVIYPWDLSSNGPTDPLILLPESFTRNIITVKQIIYIFTGNRGRIYYSNGSQADLWVKVPDHISGTVQPTFGWGAAMYDLNKLYFGIFNGGTAPLSSNAYGGVWVVDIDTEAMYVQNILSDGVYTGYCCALLREPFGGTANPSLPFGGYGMFAGSYNNTEGGQSGSSVIDQSISTPYTGGQSYVTSDMIPVGGAITPSQPTQVEFKLSRPLVSGESVQVLVGQYLDMSYALNTSFFACKFNGSTTFSTVEAFSGISDGMPVQLFQWLLVQCIITSTALSPSFVRLTELRVKNITIRQTALYNLE